MDFPDDEALRRMREIREMSRLMGSAEQRRMIEEIRRATSDPMVQLAKQQAQIASEAMDGFWSRHNQYLVQQARDIAASVAPMLAETLKKELSSILTTSALDVLRNEQIRVAQEVASSFAKFQQSLAPDITESIRAMAGLNDSPYRLALETMRRFDFLQRSPEFQNFVTVALKTAESKPLTKKSLTEIKNKQLSKKKIRRLTREQKFWLAIAVELLGVLIATFAFIQAGKPVKIDPAQLEQLRRPEVVIPSLNLTPITKPAKYIVDRPCTLRTKGSWKSPIVEKLSEGDVLEVIEKSHKWLHVKFGDKEGWVNKKYLEELTNE